MNSRYDVIVVGGGLSGLSVANELSELKVLVIDMKKEPHKGIACAEWTPKLPEFAPFAKSSVEHMEIHYGRKVKILKSPGFIINREKYQEKLLNDLKADVHLGERVMKVEGHDVITTYGRYRGDFIVGADGPKSVFTKNENIRFLVAINARVPLRKEIKNTIVFFDKKFKYGYAWCFPRGEMANCGVGAESKNIKKLLSIWLYILKKRGIVNSDKVYDVHTGLIPLDAVHFPKKDYYYLAGDAGGFIDPLTGAGIAFSKESAKIVKHAILEGKHGVDYKKYLESSPIVKFLQRRKYKRRILEEEWENIEEAVKKSWLSSFRE